MLLPEHQKQHYYDRKTRDKKIIGLDVETNTEYPQDKVFMIQIYSDDMQRVFFPDDPNDMEDLALYLNRNRSGVISCFNTMFDMVRAFKCIGQLVDWETVIREDDPGMVRYTWKITKKYPLHWENQKVYCYFDVIPLPTPDMVKKVDVRVKWFKRFDNKGAKNVIKSHECSWMFGSVQQAAPFVGMEKLDRSIAVLDDNERARWLVANRHSLKSKKDKIDLNYLIDYGMADAEIAYRAAQIQQELLPGSIGANSPASPARLFIKDARLPRAPRSVMDDTWEAYFGGLSLMIDRGVHHCRKDCNIYDFLSFYPSTIKNLKIFNLDYIDAEGFDFDIPKRVSDVLDFEYHYCIHAKVKGMVLSKEIVYYDGIPKLIPVRGEFEGWFWDCELPFLEVIDWDDIHFFAYMRYYPIQRETEEMLLKRAQMKSSDPQRLGMKILLNSMYGCLAQHYPKAGAAFNSHRASLLTAMCRSTLLDTILRNYPNAIMCDTDSMALRGEPKYDKKLMSLDFDKSISLDEWSKEKLYYFQKEFTFRHYVAVRLKRYMMIDEWRDDWTFNDYIQENKRINALNRKHEDDKNYQRQQLCMKYAYHATTVSRDFMDMIFDYVNERQVDVPDKYMMAFRQTYKRWLDSGKMEMIGGFTKAKELIGNLDFGIYMDNWINDDHKLYRDNQDWLAKQKGRFHTQHSLKEFNDTKPYVQDLRRFKDDEEKRKEVYRMLLQYGANTKDWEPVDRDKNLDVLKLAKQNMFDKKRWSSG